MACGVCVTACIGTTAKLMMKKGQLTVILQDPVMASKLKKAYPEIDVKLKKTT